MTRTRGRLLAVLLVVVGFLGYQQYQQMVEERAAESARETAAKIRKSLAEQRKLAEAQAAQLPAPDTSMSFLPKGFPRPASAWQSTEKAYYEGLLSRGRFDILVVPYQVQEFGLDRSTRSLMAAELALAIGALQKKVPDPYLVARALGDGYRRLNPEDVYRLARRLHVGRIVWGYVGYTGDAMRITIQQQAFSEDAKLPPGALETRNFGNLPFSAENPPIEIHQNLLAELLKSIGLDSPAPVTPGVETRFDATDIPPSPLGLTSGRTEPARDAYAFQLLAALTPEESERTRERFAEKSMLAVLSMSPASPDYRVLKARGFMQLGQRPAALKALGTPDSDEAKHLFHVLNGNLPEVRQYAPRVGPGVRTLIARLELNRIEAAYGTRTQKDSLTEANKLKLPGRSWPFLAARAFTDWDVWAQHENAALKRLLDRDFPIASFTSEQIVRGAASLGDVSRMQTGFDLSVLDHVRKFTEARSNDWCCRPLAPRVNESDYLDLLEGTGTSNLVSRAAFLVYTQGSPQAALDFLARIDSAYRDEPQLTVVRARAELGLSRQAEGSSKTGLRKSAYEHAFNAYYWEQGQSRYAATARNLVSDTDLAEYGNFDNPYASDLPFQPFFPNWQGNRTDLTERNGQAAVANSTFNFRPVNWLSNRFVTDHEWAKFDQLLKSIEGRFAGNPQRSVLLAQNSERKGDLASAKRYYRESIKSQPRQWTPYAWLGQILFEDGDVSGAAQLFMSYPGFGKDSGENTVGVSSHAFEAGSLFYWGGHFAQAMPLYRIAAGLQTGSEGSLSSEIRINLAKGDYVTALAGSFQRASRYNSHFAYRDYLGMLHAMGRNEEAWDAFSALVGHMQNPELWETPLVGHRKTGAAESEIAQWVAREPMSKTGYAGMYLLRAGVTDRMPDKELPAAIAAVERPVWKFDDKYGFVVREALSPKTYHILNQPAGSALPSDVVERNKKFAVKSDLVYFAEAYRLARSGDFARAKGLYEEALALYDVRRTDMGYLLPYYAFAAAKSGDAQAVLARLEKFEPADRRFDYYLARAVVAGLGDKTSDSLRDLKLALLRRPFTQYRPVYSEYEFGEICEWLFQATKKPAFRDVAVSWAKSVQGFSPWFAWPYAMEARLTSNRNDRERAIAMAYYLDPKSERLSKIPKSEISAAVKGFAGRNLFLRTQRALKESST